MCELHVGIAVVSSHFTSQFVLVRLARTLDQRYKGDKAKKEEELAFVAIDGVHSCKEQRLAEALIAHVEGADEAKILLGHAISSRVC